MGQMSPEKPHSQNNKKTIKCVFVVRIGYASQALGLWGSRGLGGMREAKTISNARISNRDHYLSSRPQQQQGVMSQR